MPAKKVHSPAPVPAPGGGAAAGVAGGGGGSATGTASSAGSAAAGGKEESRRKVAKSDAFPLTNDERNFLANLISTATKGAKGNSGQPALLQETWWTDTAMPSLVSITTKVLKLAAEQYETIYKDSPSSLATGNSAFTGGGGDGAGVAGGTGGPAGSEGIAVAASSSAMGASVSTTVSPSGAAARAVAANAPPPPPAGTPAQFVEENKYLVEQLRQLVQCPFTIERLVEILSEPAQHHCTKEGKPKPEALQAALRRCILVTYPPVVAVTTEKAGEPQ